MTSPGRGPQSLVLVSRLPFTRLFQALLSLIAPEYFDKLAPCLEAGEWPLGQPEGLIVQLWDSVALAGRFHRTGS